MDPNQKRKIINLRTDPFERAWHESEMYLRCLAEGLSSSLRTPRPDSKFKRENYAPVNKKPVVLYATGFLLHKLTISSYTEQNLCNSN